MTYHSRAGIRDFSLERDPLVVGPLFVSKGPQKGPPDVIHRVETHGRALEHTAAGQEMSGDRLETLGRPRADQTVRQTLTWTWRRRCRSEDSFCPSSAAGRRHLGTSLRDRGQPAVLMGQRSRGR